MRQVARIVSVAVIIEVGVNGDGRREVLGMAIGASEAQTLDVIPGSCLLQTATASFEIAQVATAGFLAEPHDQHQ